MPEKGRGAAEDVVSHNGTVRWMFTCAEPVHDVVRIRMLGAVA